MSCSVYTENFPDRGSVYVRENGQLYKVNQVSGGVRNCAPNPRPSKLFSEGFSVELCVNRENDNGRTDHFIFTYTKEGNLRYSAKSLFSLALSYIADNINHVDSMIGFPEQIAEKLFYAADVRQKFTEPGTGLGALQKFTDAYGNLVLRTLCLKNSYLVISEKLEEIKSFRDLICLDLSSCKLGDEHELLEHITSERLSRCKVEGLAPFPNYLCVPAVWWVTKNNGDLEGLKCVDPCLGLTRLLLKDNCLSDIGVCKMTAPVRIMKRGLESLSVLDLSCNPGITNKGLKYLCSFKKLNYLDLSGTGLKDKKAAICWSQTQIGLFCSEVPLKEFDHNSCKTEGWAEQTILQWEHAILEAIRPQENLNSRGAVQSFYGKRPRAEGPLEYPTATRESNFVNLQFYKGREEMSSFSFLKGKPEIDEELHKKRDAVEQKEQNFKSNNSSFSKADWDLLNSY